MVKDTKKSMDLLLALGLNIIFIIVYLVVLGPIHETNDDIAISFLLEGVYGERSPYIIYQNVLWGKFLVGLYTLIPTIKWYVILMYMILFISFFTLTYILLRMQGRKFGLVSSVIALLFCGYNTYVVFQYSRIAPVVTAIGLLMLFFAIDYADTLREKKICIIIGGLLALWGSMIRFQMFALAVVLCGGSIGIYLIFQLFVRKDVNWVKKIIVYVSVFGAVGGLSLALYIVDKLHYTLDEHWNYYQEFNEVRTELWDYGFPYYEGNTELYEKLGINPNDYNYYITWNMDEEAVPLEAMHQLAEAKAEKSLNLNLFFGQFPIFFLKYGTFKMFLVVAFFALLLNWKNIYFIIFDFCGIMVFEAYFMYINRYFIARVDNGMWMVAIITLLYAISKDIKKFKLQSWILSGLLICMVAQLFWADNKQQSILIDGQAGSTKTFYQEISQDKDHLYVVLSSLPRLFYSKDFWEPGRLGEFSNVYNAYGWEFNAEVKYELLENYNVSNVYADSINNDEVYFVSGSQTPMLQTYIQENYNADANLTYVKDIEGVSVWSVETVKNN